MKLLKYGLALVAAFAITVQAAQAQTLAAIKQRGTLNVGMLVDFPPFGIVNEQNEPDGYDADVARGLAKSLGVKINLIAVTGPNRIPYLLSKRVDLLIASLGITAERAKSVEFSTPYSEFKISVFGKKDVKVTKPEDLVGKHIGVARASTQDVVVTKVAPAGTIIQRFDDDASAVQALISGQVPLIGCSSTVQQQVNKVAPDTYDVKFDLQEQVQGIAIRPGEKDLLDAANAYIAQAKQDGSLNQIHQKWLGTPLPADIGVPTKS